LGNTWALRPTHHPVILILFTKSWTFRHPDFHADRRDALENIKRKVPAARKSGPTRGPHGESPSPSSVTIEALQAQVERLVQTQDDMSAHIRHLENNYQNVLTEMVNFQRNMAQQDGLMQNLISYFLQMENGQFNFWKAALFLLISTFLMMDVGLISISGRRML
jgi:hypothetical protein